MPSNLSITLIQSNLHWENVDANLQMFSQKITGVQTPTDIIILPEMFSTGFSMNAPKLAEGMDGKAVNWMRQTAAAKNCIVTGSLIITAPVSCSESKMAYYNRLVWMQPDGEYLYYDKRHLFSLSKEEMVFEPGNERLIAEWKGWKICPLICYDLRFPVWSRNTDNGYDLLLYVANWPERRVYAWKHLLVARAIENQCYVAGINRIGNDGLDFHYSGDSMVLDAMGNVLYHKNDGEDVFTIELNYEALQKTKDTLPFLKDADKFSLNPKVKIQAH
jgi:omega-amidase